MENRINVLLIHNLYQHAGGEDVVFRAEKELLEKNDRFNVYDIIFDNKRFNSGNFLQKFYNSLFIIFNPFSFWKVYKFVKQHKINVVHVHNYFYEATASVFWGAKLAGAKTIMTVHNYRLVCVGGNLLRKGKICESCVQSKLSLNGIVNRCFQQSFVKSLLLTSSNLVNRIIGSNRNKVDYYLTLTPFMSHMLLSSKLNIPENKILVKSNFMKDYGRASMGLRESYYLFVGRLSHEKGIIQLLKSWSNIDKPLYIIGDGDLKEEVLMLSETNPHIKILGPQPKEKVIEHMTRCKALVFPSICYEGMPLTILEAKNCGTVVIAKRTKNIEGLLNENKDGLFYEDNIYEALYRFEKMSQEVNLEMMQNARQDFENRFTEVVTIDYLSQVYKKALSSNHSTS
jgi:glycosyltransferase involved in cell wall biosynthesis